MRKLLFALSLVVALPSLTAYAADPCHARCKELAGACKDDCKITRPPISAARHRCLKGCDKRQHACRAGCY